MGCARVGYEQPLSVVEREINTTDAQLTAAVFRALLFAEKADQACTDVMTSPFKRETH